MQTVGLGWLINTCVLAVYLYVDADLCTSIHMLSYRDSLVSDSAGALAQVLDPDWLNE